MLQDVLQIRMAMVCCYAVRMGGAVYLIDTGFVGGENAIERALDQDGWRDLPVKGILLTHGHLDHTLNVVALASHHGAWVAAPEADRVLLEGDFSVTGLGCVGGMMQQAGATMLNYKKPTGINWFYNKTSCEFPAGIEAVPLPGHTDGHTGFLFGRYLFCGDLFASFGAYSHRSPGIFNHHGEQAEESLLKVADMDIDGILPCHCDKASPETHLERLRRMA
ncbi:MAG: MBL fold metallo-hydrolase [Verrucomicrobia bacterium]|nr:MBL fold metallo-hydrolase [Verrucomicrobiota bacterium]